MAIKTWRVVKIRYCDHAGQEVSLESQVVYPAEWMPEQPPRTLVTRCSHGIHCSLCNGPACVWAGTNPTFDPFLEAD
jgi:hypothetical protein